MWDGEGTFTNGYVIQCDTNGSSNPCGSTLTFTVAATGLNFAADDKGGLFVADVIGPNQNTGIIDFGTGAVVPPFPPPVATPEPSTLALFGSLLLALAAVRGLRLRRT
jgi:hypothetical protein